MPYRPDAALPRALVVEDKVKPVQAIIMGGPGCGKHTVCRSLCEKYGMVHISIGDVLREKVRQKTESSELIQEYMAEGRLVPDELAISIVREKINSPEVQERGWLLDNFPRTSDQAEAMMELGIIPDKFIYINVPEDVLVERCLGRLVDPVTGEIYHKTLRPPPDDPEIANRLENRDDDHEDAVTRRLELFWEGSEDVLEIFNDIKLELDGMGAIREVLKAAHLYVKPPAPLYADVSQRPAKVSAEELKEQFTRRAEESKARAPAEGEEPPEPEADDDEAAGRPPLIGDDFRRQLALDMIDICMGKLFDEEQERSRVRRLTYQFAAQHAMGSLDTLVNVLFLQHDKGDQAADPSWAAGDEPMPAVVDTWGRGVVPLKPRLKPLTEKELQQGGDGSRPTSARSRASKTSAATGGGMGTAKKKEEKKGKKEEKKKEEKKPPEEMSTEDKLRAFLKAKNDEAQAKAKKAREYTETVQKMERQIKSLTSRGQNFTMDYKGEVIMVNEIPGDKIPGPNVSVKSALAMAPKPPQDPKFNAAAGGGAAPNKKFFTPSDTVQPPAVESHVLSTGVVLKEGGQTREGPPRAKDSLHMTRKEYTAIIEAENPTLSASMRMSQEEEETKEDDEDGEESGMLSARGAAAGAGAVAGAAEGGLVPGAIPGLIATGLLPAQPTAAVEAEVAEAAVYDWEKTEFYEKDKRLVGLPDDQRTKKPDAKVRERSVGVRPKNPRDRFIFPEAVVARDYLPPPIYPGAYGHGVVTSYLADQNQFIRDEAVLKQVRYGSSLVCVCVCVCVCPDPVACIRGPLT
eukprot:Tamp_05877.p1 GENE.Tamp_05877~~Tamp_05877.p1  ORF type:complete len:818 (-),score=285.58 Tamp_05877:401-2806(-)